MSVLPSDPGNKYHYSNMKLSIVHRVKPGNGPRQCKVDCAEVGSVVVDSTEVGSPSISESTTNGIHQVRKFRVSKCSSIRCLICPKLTTDKYFKSILYTAKSEACCFLFFNSEVVGCPSKENLFGQFALLMNATYVAFS